MGSKRSFAPPSTAWTTSFLGATALLAVELGPYDALAHSMTGIATGGFSPYDTSINHFDSVAVEIVIMAIMFVGAVNFALMWRSARHRSLRPLLADPELRLYVGILAGTIGLITLVLMAHDDLAVAAALRGAAFNVVSLMSTCGFGTADYVQWTASAQLVLLSSWSRAGWPGRPRAQRSSSRIQVAVRHARRELRRVHHPRGVFPIRLGHTPVPDPVVTSIVAFLLFYFVLAVAGVVTLALPGADLSTAAGSIATAMGGVGPGLGATGPASNFLALDAPQRLVLDGYMILGRLEIIPVLGVLSVASSSLGRRRRRTAVPSVVR